MKVIFENDESSLPVVETTLYSCYLRRRRRIKSGKEFELYVLNTASGEFSGPLDRFDPDKFEENDKVRIRYFEKNGFRNFYKVEKVEK